MRNGLEEFMPRVAEWLGALPGRILAFFITAGFWLLESGIKLLLGLRDGIITAYESVKTWFIELPGRIVAFFANARNWIKSDGKKTIDGMKDGIGEGYENVKTWFRELPGKVVSFFATAGTWLFESGKSVLKGFADGIRNGLASAREAAVQGLADIRGLFPNSPAKWGPFSGQGWVSHSGKATGETFADSMAASLRASRSAIAGELQGVQTEFDALTFTPFKSDTASARAFASKAGSSVMSLVGESTRNVQVSLAGMEVRASIEGEPFTMLIEGRLDEALGDVSNESVTDQLGTN